MHCVALQDANFTIRRRIGNGQFRAAVGIDHVAGVDRIVIAGEGFVVVPEHDSVVFVLAGGVAVVPVPDRRQDRELVLGPVFVADIGFQQDIGRRLVAPLDGGGGPFAAGDLIGIGGVGQRRAGHHGQLHRCGGDGGASRNGGHGGELDVGPGCIAGPAADVQPQAGAALHTVAFPDEIIQDIGLGTAGGNIAPGVLVGAFDFHPNALHQLMDRVGIDLHLIRAVGHQEMFFYSPPRFPGVGMLRLLFVSHFFRDGDYFRRKLRLCIII